MAHGFQAGDLHIDHPYATPSLPGVTSAEVYFRGIHNEGPTADRLLSASSPIAGSVAIVQTQPETSSGVAQVRTVPSLALPAGVEIKMMHNTPNGYHLSLSNLKSPLKDGDGFALTLTFEHGGSHEVKVWVQTPRAAAAETGHAHH